MSESENTVTLDSIREAVNAKYASWVLPLPGGKEYVAKNPLRLSKEKRQVLTNLQESMKEDGSEPYDVIAEALTAASETKAGATALLKELDGDLAMAMGVFEAYMEATQAGEASASEN